MRISFVDTSMILEIYRSHAEGVPSFSQSPTAAGIQEAAPNIHPRSELALHRLLCPWCMAEHHASEAREQLCGVRTSPRLGVTPPPPRHSPPALCHPSDQVPVRHSTSTHTTGSSSMTQMPPRDCSSFRLARSTSASTHRARTVHVGAGSTAP